MYFPLYIRRLRENADEVNNRANSISSAAQTLMGTASSNASFSAMQDAMVGL
jgi:hypothetical protein